MVFASSTRPCPISSFVKNNPTANHACDDVTGKLASPVNEKKYVPGRGAVNIPDVKFMPFPSFTHAKSNGIVPIVSNEEFLWT